jgi:hypothetical protein
MWVVSKKVGKKEANNLTTMVSYRTETQQKTVSFITYHSSFMEHKWVLVPPLLSNES